MHDRYNGTKLHSSSAKKEKNGEKNSNSMNRRCNLHVRVSLGNLFWKRRIARSGQTQCPYSLDYMLTGLQELNLANTGELHLLPATLGRLSRLAILDLLDSTNTRGTLWHCSSTTSLLYMRGLTTVPRAALKYMSYG